MVKYLIVRFSSIGDIVLTTPIIRGLKQQVENAEVHFLTKPKFAGLLENNPYLSKTHLLKEDINDTVNDILLEEYDYIIDLHNNLRTSIIKRKIPVVNFTFDKLNLKKWLLVNLKINKMPHVHIVDRYMDTVNMFDVKDDEQGLDFFIPEKDELDPEQVHAAFKNKYLVAVVGANHFTKQIPTDKLSNILNNAGVPVCLIGGNDVLEQAKQVESALKIPFLNAVGKFNLNQSASIIKQSVGIITPDTGMMHIAAALNKPILSLWGNTVPEFGMYAYKPVENSMIFEDKTVKCRPCTKIGFKKCPKKHFNCMNNIDNAAVIKQISKLL